MNRLQTRNVTVYSLLFSIIAISILSRLFFNGLFLGFDFGIYQPDGAHYFYRTLVFLGHDSISASNQVADWYRLNGFKNNTFDPALLRPENVQLWGLVSPRLLYSILSMPFVWLIGAPGMMVVPVISFVVLCMMIFKVAKIHLSAYLGILLVFVLTVSPTILRWMISNVTDGLLCALFAIVAYILAVGVRGIKLDISILVLVLCTSITRFALPIWLAISLVLFINAQRRTALLTLISSSIMSIPVFLSAPDDALLPGSNPVTLWEKVSGLAISFAKIAFYELAELAALDRVLLTLLALAVIASFANLRQIASQYFLAVLLSVWFIGAINGTVGVNFRYQMPVLGFMLWVLSVNFSKFRNRILGDGLNIVGSKTQN